jgi:hypothetical protein
LRLFPVHRVCGHYKEEVIMDGKRYFKDNRRRLAERGDTLAVQYNATVIGIYNNNPGITADRVVDILAMTVRGHTPTRKLDQGHRFQK